MATVSVRYIVDDVDSAIAFYTGHLGFRVDLHPGPGFAMLSRGNLRLLLNTPSGTGGAARAMPDGRRPEPGGWNAFSSRSTTSRGKSRSCAVRAAAFAATSSLATEASKSCSTTPPAIPSSCSNPDGSEPRGPRGYATWVEPSRSATNRRASAGPVPESSCLKNTYASLQPDPTRSIVAIQRCRSSSPYSTARSRR